MAKYEIEVSNELINFFIEKIDNIIPIEILLSKMLEFLKEFLIVADYKHNKYEIIVKIYFFNNGVL